MDGAYNLRSIVLVLHHRYKFKVYCNAPASLPWCYRTNMGTHHCPLPLSYLNTNTSISLYFWRIHTGTKDYSYRPVTQETEFTFAGFTLKDPFLVFPNDSNTAYSVAYKITLFPLT